MDQAHNWVRAYYLSTVCFHNTFSANLMSPYLAPRVLCAYHTPFAANIPLWLAHRKTQLWEVCPVSFFPSTVLQVTCLLLCVEYLATGTKSPELPSAGISLQAGQSVQALREFHRNAPVLHSFLASRLHLSCAGSPNILGTFQTIPVQMVVVHYHCAHSLVGHVSWR